MFLFCLNPTKPVPFPCNPTPLDLPGSVQITPHRLSAQAISAQNVFECSVTSARGSRPPSKDLPSAAEPPRSAEPDNWLLLDGASALFALIQDGLLQMPRDHPPEVEQGMVQMGQLLVEH
ncbi:hypothetical protein C0989_004604 [Termitomyces sp. Mn162]|nr:hypothetical protein C0989_004604 [Termitomyces sp. Mn162]